MGDLVERLEKRLRRHALAELPGKNGQKPVLETLELRDLLTVYGNWRHRCPSARPRKVHLSRELEVETEAGGVPDALESVIQRIEDGEVLKPFLSRNVEVAVDLREGTPHHLRKDLDLLLAEWGVHHLHLSSLIQSDGFAKRTRDLLFVVFRPDDAYVVGVFPHGSWSKRAVAERAVRNWPEAELFFRANYAIGLTHEWDESDSLELRKAGVNQSMMIDGRVYSPMGQMGDGSAMEVSRRVMHLIWQLKEWKSHGARWLDDASGGEFIYWVPAVRDDRCGFLGGGRFVPVADLP